MVCEADDSDLKPAVTRKKFPGATRRSNLKFERESTVRWSNFDPRDPKMGVFLQNTEATPCGNLLK